MSLTDGQFEQFLTAICRNREEHDLLIGLKAQLETYQTVMQNNLIHNSKAISKVEGAALAAHKRIDSVLWIGGGTILIGLAAAFLSNGS